MAEHQHAHTHAAASSARAPAPAPAAPHSAAADLRHLAAQLKAGAVGRKDYLDERDRIRSNWSKSVAPHASQHAHDHHACGSECHTHSGKGGCQHGPPKGGGCRGDARRMEVLAQLKKACEAGDAAALKAVLKANPDLDIDALEDEGEMASPLLNLAAESGFCDCVKVLIDVGKVAVDTLGEFGTTALFDACYFDNRSVAEALLERGASASFEDADGSTPLYAAAFQGNSASLDLMLRHNVTVYYHRGKDRLTPLHAAVLGGSKECVLRLLEAGHPLDPPDAEAQTPLLAASNGGPCGSNGKKECLLELVKAGADVKAADALGRNAMQLLLLQGIGCPTCTCECAERLLEKQASVLHPDAFGKTAAQLLGDMKPAPKLYSLLKRAIKRESLRNKLARAEEPEEEVDEAMLAAQEAQAASAASALLLAEEAEKEAEAQRRDKAKRKRARGKQRKHERGGGAQPGGGPRDPDHSPSPPPPDHPDPGPSPPALLPDHPSPPAAAEKEAGRAGAGAGSGLAGPVAGLAGLNDAPPAHGPGEARGSRSASTASQSASGGASGSRSSTTLRSWTRTRTRARARWTSRSRRSG